MESFLARVMLTNEFGRYDACFIEVSVVSLQNTCTEGEELRAEWHDSSYGVEAVLGICCDKVDT